MNLNLSGFFNVFKLLTKPSLCLPHATVSQFNELPFPLEKAFEGQGKKLQIKAVVLDKDDCFAYPETNLVHPPYTERFRQLQKEFPGQSLVIVSNTAGATSYDRDGKLAGELESATGVSVLSHRVKKPGCKEEIMAHFRKYPEVGVTHPSQVVVIGDRLMTDMMLANMMGSRGIWIKDGVAPLAEKSMFTKFEYRMASFLLARGFKAPEPASPFE
ncbi:putative Phosphatidylglycerophosphatase GEP4 [Seiridium unicorne]|uniref:Phosphatidylglycerophosphatase GEP4 n=1 Tax=Seiridium unicorne TaxID=138068 RepID=A0ABR2UN97_9PEZI